MFRRSLVWLAAAVAAFALFSWNQRQGDPIGRLLRPEPPPRPFEFDNGTVRRHAPPASQPDGARARTPLAPGALRKCSRGTEVSYTDRACPPGHAEGGLTRGTMNVIGADGAPRQAAREAPPQPAGRSSLYDVLDPGADAARLRQRTMERALE